MTETSLLIRQIIQGAMEAGAYGDFESQRRPLIFRAMGERGKALCDALPEHPSRLQQLRSDVLRLAERSGRDGEPLASWLEGAINLIEPEGRVGAGQLQELLAEWRLQAEGRAREDLGSPGEAPRWAAADDVPGRPRRLRLALAVTLAAVALAILAAVLLMPDERQCGDGDVTARSREMVVSGRDVVFDTGHINRRLRRWRTDGEQPGTGLIKALHSRADDGGISRVRLSAAIDDEVTSLAVEAQAGYLIVVGDRPLRTRTVELTIEGPEPVPIIFRADVTAGRKLVVGNDCFDSNDSWPELRIERGLFVTGDLLSTTLRE